MKALLSACIGFLLAYFGIGFWAAMVALIGIYAAVEILSPSKSSKERREDREWAKADPFGYWEAHKK